MSYGNDEVELGRNTAFMVGQILKGAKPADIPILQPTKFGLALNLKPRHFSPIWRDKATRGECRLLADFVEKGGSCDADVTVIQSV